MYINVAGLDAMRDELLASGLHVGYHHLGSFWEPGAISVMPVPMTMEHADPGRGELHKPQRLVHLVIVIGVETCLIHIEGLGAVNIGNWYRYQFDLPVHAWHGIPRLRHSDDHKRRPVILICRQGDPVEPCVGLPGIGRRPCRPSGSSSRQSRGADGRYRGVAEMARR